MKSLPKRNSDFRSLLISGLSFSLSIAIKRGRQFLLFRVAFDAKVLADPYADVFGVNGMHRSFSSLEEQEPLGERLGVSTGESLCELPNESPLDIALEHRPITGGGALGTTDSKLSFIKFFVK